MIALTSLSEARVLVVGAGDLVNENVRNFISQGVLKVTVLHPSIAPIEERVHHVKKDPETCMEIDRNYFQNFDIVLSANQPRSFELALSDIRWPQTKSSKDLDLPLIVMRNVSNNCKFRCQYKELPIQGSESSKFVSLPMDLLPWTDEKRSLIASTIEKEFEPAHNPDFRAYLSAAHAIITFHEEQKSWPDSGDSNAVFSQANFDSELDSQVRSYVDLMCEKGLSAAQLSTAILGRLIVLDAVKLLTGCGQPINNTNLDDVIRIAAKFI